MVAFYFYLFILLTIDVHLSDTCGVNYVVLRYKIRELNNLISHFPLGKAVAIAKWYPRLEIGRFIF